MDSSDIFDVIIVGAGPCGLATAARLREHTPAALFTDEEHRRFHWIRKYGSGVSIKHVRSGKVSTPRRKIQPEYKMLVLDGTDDKWLGRWNELFATYDITHLRSPMLWHVDPLDRDSLLAHTYSERRENELVEIRNCVGKEISKHAKKKSTGSRHCGKKYVVTFYAIVYRVLMTLKARRSHRYQFKRAKRLLHAVAVPLLRSLRTRCREVQARHRTHKARHCSRCGLRCSKGCFDR